MTTHVSTPTRSPLGRRATSRKSGLHLAVLAATKVLAVIVFALVSTAGPSSAAEPDETLDGWARVAHLSPDTKSVDVALTAVAGGQVLFDLEDVAYGDVSDYLRFPAGSYVVEMTPAGSVTDAAPAISELITVTAGEPITLAVTGLNADLTTKVINDDLTPPADGEARVRVLQASTVADSVDITTTSGMAIASDAKSGQVTGYATVDDGPWDLQLAAGSTESNASIELESGSVNTLLVLDNAEGGLTIKAISDSGSVSETPVGGTNTGAAPSAAAGSDTMGAFAAEWTAGGIIAAAALITVLAAHGTRRRAAPVLSGRRR